MSEGEVPLDRSWIERLMGIERDETSCIAVMYRLTCEVRPILAFEEEESQPITVTLLFSGRRTSCRGRSTGAFEACMPEGATIEKDEIRAFSSRNGNIRHYKEEGGFIAEASQDVERWFCSTGQDENGNKKYIEIRKKMLGDGKLQLCVMIPWRSASGGRTGIGECRYHDV